MTIAGQIYKLAMDSVEAIGKAVTWVFERVTVGIQKLIDFLGFLFAWGDILTTADSVVALINAALDYGTDMIPGLKAQKDAFLAALKASVAARTPPETTAAGCEMKDPNETASMDTMKNSVGYNWTSYQVSYSGMATNGSITDPISALNAQDGDPTIEDLWNDASQIFQSVENLVDEMGNDVQDLFTPTTTTTDVWNRLQTDLIQGALDTTSNVADFLLDALSLVLTSFRNLGNQEIQLPIFSALWKTVAKGRDFTVLNALALIVAIPTTILYKAVLGKAPPSLAGMTKATFGAYVNGTLPDKDLGITHIQILWVMEGLGITALRLQTDFQALSFIYKTVTTAKSETLDTCMIFVGVVQQIVFWPVSNQKDMAFRWTVSIPEPDSDPCVFFR